ncbi:4Fe-4S binding protein [Candidatus Woesearchaeota archaeon]|jgi:pyruvate ferredoxin oxidoreductase delta subunit|nr:4Fe-4S binding protein [Candidatus Woesearchaeota archaeon]MBT5271701.1 4Fe-4S binding protein [Candidatus Woesearchaeota archaeon]MBT6041109.1 4Fe-4S binding protein [Candidatus Woesearchaeota archaeon]MBT6337434.1 4Fe-4S binding protein [Candidatus Woesearchaeota archaeon]MBT7926702.1 4Fe-4S binding protein [Candidatus Woesearchaeota archaeon]
MTKLKTYKEIPIGGLIEKAGSSVEFKTGDWKAFKPVWDKEKCIHCMICPVLCPEDCIPVIKGKDPKRKETDFDYCKGCGICAKVCPVKCIKMIEEGSEGDSSD